MIRRQNCVYRSDYNNKTPIEISRQTEATLAGVVIFGCVVQQGGFPLVIDGVVLLPFTLYMYRLG